MMKGICLRYAASEMEAEDILQEAFVQIFKKLDSYNGKGAFGGWIRKITINKALEQYRKNKSIRRIKDEMFTANHFEPNSDLILENLELKDLLSKIQKLPVGYRTVFNLYAIEGYSHKEIGEMLSIAEGTSKSQFSRARYILIEMIKTEEVSDKKRIAYARG